MWALVCTWKAESGEWCTQCAPFLMPVLLALLLFVRSLLTIPCAAMRAAKVLLPEVPGVQSERRTSCPPTRVRSISVSTASACSALSYSTTPKPLNGLPSSWASYSMENNRDLELPYNKIFLSRPSGRVMIWLVRLLLSGYLARKWCWPSALQTWIYNEKQKKM